MSQTTVIVASLVLGLAAGVLSGMFGIGGGLVIVPILIIVFGEPAKTAVGTSLFALMWPVGLLGVLEYWRRGEMKLTVGLWIAVGLFIGAFFGAKITGAISTATMKRAYGVFLLIMGVYFVTTAGSPQRPATTPSPAPSPSTTPVEPFPGGPPDQVH